MSAVTVLAIVAGAAVASAAIWPFAHGLGYRKGREDAGEAIDEFAAIRRARAEEFPPETAFAHLSNRNILTAYGTAAGVARGSIR